MGPNTTHTIIFDIDGTLSDPTHRRPIIEDPDNPTDREWDKFFSLVHKDDINHWAGRMLRMYYHNNYNIVIVTGRRGDNDTKQKTIKWLKRHDLFHHELYMRKDGDRRPDHEVKKEILEEELDDHNIELVVDDRTSVVEMWRNQGLNTLQCAEGDF